MVKIIEEDDEDEFGKDVISGQTTSFTTEGSSPPPPPQQSHNKVPSPPARQSEDSQPEFLASSDETSHDGNGFSPEEDGTPNPTSTDDVPPAVVVMSMAVKDESLAAVSMSKVELGDGFSGRVAEEGRGGHSPSLHHRDGRSGGGGWRRHRPTLSILRRAKRESMIKKAALGLRVCGFAFCLISFSVLAADRNKGWALDSFDRYKEFRYCISVTVIAAGYSGLQAYHVFMDARQILPYHLRCYFDFLMDQILTYLLISASSSAAVRVDDWRSNWGLDKFPELASAAVGMSFMAFVAFALSSLISGYTLSTVVRS